MTSYLAPMKARRCTAKAKSSCGRQHGACNNEPCAGGFKLWECSLDLAQWLWTASASADASCAESSPTQLTSRPSPPGVEPGHAADGPAASIARRLQSANGCRVLELGCGHGMPGIVAALCGAEVHFQVCAHQLETSC